MDKVILKKLTFKLFEFYYSDLTPNDNNLDKYVYFKDKNDVKRIRLTPFHGKYLLGYYKQDFELIKQHVPVSKWFFEKFIMEWVEEKYGYDIDGVLLPLKRF